MTILPIKKISKENKEPEGRITEASAHIVPPSHLHYIQPAIQNDIIFSRRRTPLGYLEERPTTSINNENNNQNEIQLPKRKSKAHRANRKLKLQSLKNNSNANNAQSLEDVNSGDEYDNQVQDPEKLNELYLQFEKSIEESRGFKIKRMAQDGACLFRAIADQVYGDQEMHNVVRRLCMDYMEKNADYFSQFVTEKFEKYIARKRHENSHGNHLEIQAMAEMYNRPMEVYEHDLEPINIFHGYNESQNEPIRLSYYRNMHYDSIVDPIKATIGVGLGLPSCFSGVSNRAQLTDIMKATETSEIEEAMLKDKLAVTDLEATTQAIEEQVARESYLQWLKEAGHSHTPAKNLTNFNINTNNNSNYNYTNDNNNAISPAGLVIPTSVETALKHTKCSFNDATNSTPKLFFDPLIRMPSSKVNLTAGSSSALAITNSNNFNTLNNNNISTALHNINQNLDSLPLEHNHSKPENLIIDNNDTCNIYDDLHKNAVGENVEPKNEHPLKDQEADISYHEECSQPSTSCDSSYNTNLNTNNNINKINDNSFDSTSIAKVEELPKPGVFGYGTQMDQDSSNDDNVPVLPILSSPPSAPPLTTPACTTLDDEQTRLISEYSADIFGLNDWESNDQDMIRALIASQQEYMEQFKKPTNS